MDKTPRYEPHEIEAKWQRVWEDERAFNTPNPVPGEPQAENHWYQLEMLPYPSGPSLHMGHVLNYTMGDVQTHVRRRSGWHVVRPMGWDAFGLPAENAAIKEGRHPRVTIEANIETMRAQMKRLGWAIDWEREVAAHQPTFYRWTQWLFQQFVAHDLCYRREGPVNWCPNDQTVIANEYVVDGHCERCGAEVELRNMTQWFMRTTAYADELLEYPGADWPEKTMAIQRNWIGRSEGAEVLFRVEETGDDIAVFTTRPDTLFGATFFVIAPEHPFVAAHASDEAKEYARHAGARSVEERSAATEKTGVFTGLHAVNPVNGEKLPIWVADYVLMDYGTGAIMAVPAHDERDGEFAETFSLPVVEVIDEDCGSSSTPAASTACPPTRRSARSSRSSRPKAARRRPSTTACATGASRGSATGAARSRSSTARRCGVVPVPESELPVILPDIEDYAPKGMSPLAQNEEYMNVACPSCGGAAQRDPDTMDTFVDSSWYFLRYIDSHNDEAPFDPFVVDYWLPVSQYIGGDRPLDRASPVLALLREGDERLGDGRLPRAVRAAVPPGLGDARRHEDVEDEGQRRGAGRGRRPLRRRRGAADHPLHGAGRPGHGVDARRGGGDRALPAPAVAARARGRRGGAGGGRSGRADAEGERDDRARDRRRAAALPVPHADLGGDGAAATRSRRRRTHPTRASRRRRRCR